MVTRQMYLEAKIDQVQAGIYQNETLIEWAKNGGSVEDAEVGKATIAIEKDEKWVEFLKGKLENELQVNN